MEERTIEVQGTFKPRRVTKEEFVKIWKEHATELWRLSSESSWINKISDLIEDVRREAEDEFERLFEKDNG